MEGCKDSITNLIMSPRLEEIVNLLEIAQRAQLLYTYEGSGREKGKRQTYYVPNRMLWPVRSLDPVGQHAAVSILAEKLWRAAFENTAIPMTDKEPPKTPDTPARTESDEKQRSLFPDE